MRKAILDINEMSDSKEVYGERPNPFIAAFIYSLLALLVVALIYSFYGKIEIVATASGMVRPNDDISTVSSLVGGKVTSVAYTDGQVVQDGDVLLTIDTSDAQIRLNSLLSTQKEYQFQSDMLTKFLNGIESGKNPFSSDTQSEEYPYYVRYRDFELTLRNMRETSAKEREQNLSDAERTNANIQSVQKQIADMQYQINGLTKCKESIEQGKNLATDYPEYSNMYVLYKETLDALEHNYLTERGNIMVDSTADSNRYSLDYYQAQLTEYGYLVESIVSGQSMFPEEDMSECAMMYNDYVNALAEYTRSYESAYETYMYLLDNDSVTHDTDSMLTYERTMLEGYRYYLESVENDKDMFPKTGEVSYYRSLYEDYQAKCKELDQAVLSAQATHRSLVNAAELAKENERKTKEAEQQASEQADALQDLRDAAAEAAARAAAAQAAAQAALDAVSGQGAPQTDPSNAEDTNPSGDENNPSDGDNSSPSDGDNDNPSESKADESSDADSVPNSSESDNPPPFDLPESNDESPADSESDNAGSSELADTDLHGETHVNPVDIIQAESPDDVKTILPDGDDTDYPSGENGTRPFADDVEPVPPVGENDDSNGSVNPLASNQISSHGDNATVLSEGDDNSPERADATSSEIDSIIESESATFTRVDFDGIEHYRFNAQVELMRTKTTSSPTSGPTEEEIYAAEQAIHVAETARDNYKAETVSSIRRQILQLEASIAEKEVNIAGINKKENLEPTRIQMESAQAAIETYKNSKLLEYKQVQTDLQNKITGLSYTLSGTVEKDEQVQKLETSYQNSVSQKRYETISQIDNSLQTLRSELASAQSNLRLYQITASLYERNLKNDDISTSISRSTYERISALLDNLDSLNSQLLDVDTQIQQAQEQIGQGIIKAEKSGVINTLLTVVNGDIVSSGTQIATIIPANESAFKVQIYVNSADIASISVGDAIKYNISALPSNQYGTLSGTVLRISNDAVVQDGQYSGYFLVEGSIANAELVDKDGNVGAVAIGMQTEAKIITQEKSIFRYLLEKINLF